MLNHAQKYEKRFTKLLLFIHQMKQMQLNIQ